MNSQTPKFKIYADTNGSYPISENVKTYLKERLDGPFANPNAIHSIGKNIKNAYEKCREICAEALGADRNQVFFTSGSSEGISQYIKSFENCTKKKILTSPIEHAAVREACLSLKSQGFSQDLLEVSEQGLCSTSINSDYSLACLMAANNETGVIQDFKNFGENCREKNIPFLCDTTQIFGKLDFDFKNLPIDACVLSAHKIGALQGSGILLVKDPKNLSPLIFGGGQESNKRSGTQNYIGVECMTVALKDTLQAKASFKKLESLKLSFEEELKKLIPGIVIFGEQSARLANTTLLSIPGLHGQALQIELESRNIFVTTSSACADNEPSTSMVLKAMGYGDDVGRGVIRISVQENTTQEEFKFLASSLLQASKSLKKIKSF